MSAIDLLIGLAQGDRFVPVLASGTLFTVHEEPNEESHLAEGSLQPESAAQELNVSAFGGGHAATSMSQFSCSPWTQYW